MLIEGAMLRESFIVGGSMKILIYLCIFFLVSPFAGAFEDISEPTSGKAPVICKVQCDCWGHFGNYAQDFYIGEVESWGYCPKDYDRKKLYQAHAKAALQRCREIGRSSSASKYLRSCKATF